MGGAGLPSSGSVGGATGPITVLGFNYRPLVLLGRFGGCLPTASSGEDQGAFSRQRKGKQRLWHGEGYGVNVSGGHV